MFNFDSFHDTYRKIEKKTRETLFTSKLQSAELLSFGRDFSQKIQNCNFGLWKLRRHLAAILGNFGTKIDLYLCWQHQHSRHRYQLQAVASSTGIHRLLKSPRRTFPKKSNQLWNMCILQVNLKKLQQPFLLKPTGSI